MFSDFAASRPTHVGATPVLWNAIHQEYLSRLAPKVAAHRNEGLDAATAQQRAETDAAGEVRLLLGNRCRVASVGGAPVSDEVFKFVRDVMRIDIVKTYGTRETGGITCDEVVYKGVIVELRDIDEMG